MNAKHSEYSNLNTVSPKICLVKFEMRLEEIDFLTVVTIKIICIVSVYIFISLIKMSGLRPFPSKFIEGFVKLLLLFSGVYPQKF